MNIDLKRLTSIEIDGINHRDYPDFCDAFIIYAEIDGRPLTDEELDYINDNESQFVYEVLWDSLF